MSIFSQTPCCDASSSGGIVGATLDIGGALRVSEPFTQIDITQVGDARLDLLDTMLINGGLATHNFNQSLTELTVQNPDDRVVVQSKRYGFYQAGHALLVEISGVLNVEGGAATSRIGYFDDENDKTIDTGGNGFFFYYDNGDVGVCQRSFVTGAQIDTAVLQAAWNIDPMDGTGPSGQTFEPTKANLFIIDGQWLGVGIVKLGLQIAGQTIYVHQFVHAGILDTTYTTSLNLPIRWEIFHDSESVGGAETAKALCGSIQSEGGGTQKGVLMSVDTGNTGVAVNAATALLAVRSTDIYTRSSINLLESLVLTASNNPVAVRVYLADSVTGGAWSAASVASEINTTFTSYVGRQIGIIYGSSASREGSAVISDLAFTGADIEGNQQAIILEGVGVSGAVTTWAAVNYQEVR